MRRIAALFVVALFLGLGCSRGDSEPPKRGPATPLDPATVGSITGKVVFRGTPPVPGRLQVKGDPACVESGTATAEDLLVHDGLVENAFVYVKEGLGDRVFELPKAPVTIDQRACRYIPHVLGAQTGQEIFFLNSDATLHNVHTQPKLSSAVNFGMGVKGSKRSIRINKSEVMVSVKCDVHPWMRVYIGVLDHPYFAVTDPNGAFRIENLPPGTYTLEAWHERFGQQEAKATLAEKGTAEIEFAFSGK